jgi:hypothetical protein
MAGLLDAEGCFSLSKHTRSNGYVMYDPLIRFTTTHKPTATWVTANFGGTLKQREWKGGKWKTYYQWRFGSDKHAAEFLSLILPYVSIKKKEALVLQEYYNLSGCQNPEKREQLFQTMTGLKNRESVTTDTLSFSFDSNEVNAYFAGIFDGEGSAYIVKYTQTKGGLGYRPHISVGNSFHPLINALHLYYGGSTRDRGFQNSKLQMYDWDLRRVADQEKFLLAVLPYLSIKREQSNLLLKFLRLNGVPNPVKRAEFHLQMRQLNGKKIQSDLTRERERESAEMLIS